MNHCLHFDLIGLTRRLAIRTNSFWPFSFLNRIPYTLAVKYFIHSCRKFPEIKSIYLKHNDWIPGLGDIDIIIIIDSKLTIEEEFSFVDSFLKNCTRIRRLFPMICKGLTIITDRNIKIWTRFGIGGYESQYWILIYGEKTVKNNYVIAPHKLAMDSLNNALRIYLTPFSKGFYKHKNEDFCGLLDLERRASKILSFLTFPSNGTSRRKKFYVRFDNKKDLLCRPIIQFEQRVKSLALSGSLAASGGDIKALLSKVVSHDSSFPDSVLSRQIENLTSDPAAAAIESVIQSFSHPSRLFIVLKDELDDLAVKNCADAVYEKLAASDAIPIMMSCCVFEYMLRFCSVITYIELLGKRRVLYGRDLLKSLEPPQEFFFTKNLLVRFMGMLRHQRNYRLWEPPVSDEFFQEPYYIISLEFLKLKLYLEKGVWEAGGAKEVLLQYNRHYPEYYRRMKELEKSNKGGKITQERFKLLKDLANDIHRCVVNYKEPTESTTGKDMRRVS